MAVFIVGIAFLFVFAGCSSDNSNKSEGESVKADKKDTETLYDGADEVVLEYIKAHYEYNVPVLFELAPPKVQDEYLNDETQFSYFMKVNEGERYSDVPIEDLINPEKFEEIKAEYNNEDYNQN